MLKKIAGSALAAALTLSVSAKDEDHVINFEDIKMESAGRYMRHLTSVSQGDTYAYVFGKAQVVEGKLGKCLDISDSRSRTELRLKTGDYYDLNNGTISFDIAPMKKGFGVKGEATIFEEKNADTVFGLYLNEAGRLKLKVSAMFDIPEEMQKEDVVYDEKYFAELDKPKIKFDNKSELDKAIEEQNAAKEAAAEEMAKPKYEIRDYNFHSFQLGDTKEWTPGEFQRVTVSWNLRKGLFVVYVNGKYAIRSFAAESGRLGVFLDRGNVPGSYIKFAPGNDGFSALIDNLRFSKTVIDREDK
ncbi:MAG: hypothetical protein MK132_22725 [Lentisphaerales bacterium]|nr:hypothetical protein [Lentisphaerales bacterium]